MMRSKMKRYWQLLLISLPWFANFSNCLVSDLIPEGLTYQQKKKFLHEMGKYFWDERYLYRVFVDNL